MTTVTTKLPQSTTHAHPPTCPLSIHDLTVAYHRKPVIWDIDYDAPLGKLVAIVGPNGAGKSTLLAACLDLIPRISGDVYRSPGMVRAPGRKLSLVR